MFWTLCEAIERHLSIRLGGDGGLDEKQIRGIMCDHHYRIEEYADKITILSIRTVIENAALDCVRDILEFDDVLSKLSR